MCNSLFFVAIIHFMKDKFIHLEYKTISLHLLIFVFFVFLSTVLCIAVRDNQTLFPIFLVLFLLLAFSYLGYIIFCLVNFIQRKVQQINGDNLSGKWSNLKLFWKNRKIIRRIITASFSSSINFLMGAFYVGVALYEAKYFYAILSIIYLFGFSARLRLFSYGIDADEKQAGNALLFSSVFAILISFAALGITFYIYFGNATFTKNIFLIFFIAIYTFIKLGAAIFDFFRAKNRKKYLTLSYSLISLTFAIFSMFILEIEILNAFVSDYPKEVILSGFVFAFFIGFAGVFCLQLILRRKKDIPSIDEEEDITKIE